MKLLKGIATIIGILGIGGFFVGLYKQEPGTSTARSDSVQSTTPANCEHGTPVTGAFYVKGRDINFRTGPGADQSRVINEKASAVLGRTEYRTLWPSMALEGRCETAEWLQGRIVKADGSSVNWETGWVHKKFVTDTPSADRKAGLLWDIDAENDFTAAQKQIVKRGALKVLKDEANCASIFTGYTSGSRPGAYYVSCNARNGGQAFNVWFTPEDVKSGITLAVPESYPETQSRQACERAIKDRVSHPSTLDIHHVLGYATEVHNNGNRTVIQEFTAKNGFGLELTYQARCLILPDGTLEIYVKEAN